MLGSTAAVLVFFFVCVLIENVFVVEETLDLRELSYKRIIKVSWIFSGFSFWGESVNRNSIIMISKGYHYVINLGIFSNFLYQYRQDLWRRENPNSPKFICYDRSFGKDHYIRSTLIFGKKPIVADVLGGIHRSSIPLSTMSLGRT